jgi:hypothetical protein
MSVPTSEVGYSSATTWRGNHEVHKRRVVPLEENIGKGLPVYFERIQNMNANKHLARSNKFWSQRLRNFYLDKKGLITLKIIYIYI